MRIKDQILFDDLSTKLNTFSNEIHQLKGIQDDNSKNCLINQIIDSTRRIDYVTRIRNATYSPTISDPTNDGFNPIKAASYFSNNNMAEESFWLVFLITHFGKNKFSNWNLLKEFYKGDGTNYWTWDYINNNRSDFISWLTNNEARLRNCGSFGNHRKYESIQALNANGTGNVVIKYLDFIGNHNSHNSLISTYRHNSNSDKDLFHKLYKESSGIHRFGRMARFDYLTMIGKLGLADITPDSTYIKGTTGPLNGARILFQNNKRETSLKRLEMKLCEFEHYLDLYFGNQVLEDALCNWQKSQNRYIYFRG